MSAEFTPFAAYGYSEPASRLGRATSLGEWTPQRLTPAELNPHELVRRLSNYEPQFYRRLAAKFELPGDARLEGADASEYLASIASWVRQDMLRNVVNRLSPAGWLWCLRRVPTSVLRGSQPTTPLLALRIAEELSGYSIKRGSSDFSDVITRGHLILDVTPRTFDAVTRLLAGAGILRYLESTQRRASKGQTLEWSAEASLPHTTPDAALDARLEEFDQRLAKSHLAWSSLIAADGSKDAIESFPLLVVNRNRAGKGLTHLAMVPGRRPQQAVSAFSLATAFLSNRIQHPSITQAAGALKHGDFLTALLVICSMIESISFENAEVGLVQVGYLALGNEQLVQGIEQQLARLGGLDTSALTPHIPRNAGEVIARLTATSVLEGTVHGPVLRPFGPGWFVDFHAASSWLLTRLFVDKAIGGKAVNVVGLDFEAYVQGVIDKCAAVAPVDALRKYRGRDLVLAGVRITDLDALFTYENTLVLVSCKTPDFTPTYDLGDYREIRNGDKAVSDALEDWANRVKEIRANPVGSTYNFAGWNIVGVVVSPRLIFTSNELAYSSNVGGVPGLRGYQSASELERLLAQLSAS